MSGMAGYLNTTTPRDDRNTVHVATCNKVTVDC